MRKPFLSTFQKIRDMDDKWVQKAQSLALSLMESLEGKGNGEADKERQLRNIQSVAEQSNSWRALELFMRYQAARKEIPENWVGEAIDILGDLEKDARTMLAPVNADTDISSIHMELVSRVLGYTIRWHVWNAAQKKEQRKIKQGKEVSSR